MSSIDSPLRSRIRRVAGIGPGQHEQRVVADDRERVEARARRESEFGRLLLAHDERGGCAHP